MHSDILSNRVERSGSGRVVMHKAAAIGLLKDQLEHLSSDEDLDAAVLTVLALARNELDQGSMRVGVVLQFEPHLPTASWMNVYGRVEPVETHARAMLLLVERAGGLPNLKLPGLAATIAYADLLDASATYRKPAFACWWEMDKTIVHAHSGLRSGAGNAPGRAFFTKGTRGLPGSAISVLVCLATVDRYMAARHNKALEKEEENLLVMSRNTIQHRLLSLPSFEDLSESETEGTDPVGYEICRLTAVIYSNAVILGLPPHTRWHEVLAKRLRALLESNQSSSVVVEVSDLLIWALCVGGLAAWRTPEREFFESALRNATRKRKLLTWVKVERVVEDFLWSQSACKHGAAMIWLSL